MKQAEISSQIQRLRSDFDYYCRNVLWIKSKEQGLVKLKLNQPQRFIYYGIPETLREQYPKRYRVVPRFMGWAESERTGRPIRDYTLKARQEGISTESEAWLFHKAHTNPGTNSLVVAHDDNATSDLFAMTKLFYTMLPEVLKPIAKISNTRELNFQNPKGSGGLNSWIKGQTAGWQSIGRGKTVHHLHLSELGFYLDPGTILDGLFEAVPRAPRTSIIIETTPNGIGTPAYDMWNQAKKRKGGFQAVFLPWFACTEYVIPPPKDWEPDADGRAIEREFGVSWDQLYWREKKIEEAEIKKPGQGKRKFQQEYASDDFTCWVSSGDSAFVEDSIEWLFNNTVKDPETRYDIRNGKRVESPSGKLLVWEKPETGKQYAIGVDVGGGVGLDSSVICVLTYPGYRQVAEWSDDKTDPKKLATIIATVGMWYNEAMVAVEVNGAGILTNTVLNEDYWNLYRWEYFDRRRKVETEKVGWETNFKTKELLVDFANTSLAEQGCIVRSAEVVRQMKSFLASPLMGGGTHYEGRPDDELMAWLIAMMCAWRKIGRYDFTGGEDDRKKTREDEPGELENPAARDRKMGDLFHPDRDSYSHWLSM